MQPLLKYVAGREAKAGDEAKQTSIEQSIMATSRSQNIEDFWPWEVWSKFVCSSKHSPSSHRSRAESIYRFYDSPLYAREEMLHAAVRHRGPAVPCNFETFVRGTEV